MTKFTERNVNGDSFTGKEIKEWVNEHKNVFTNSFVEHAFNLWFYYFADYAFKKPKDDVFYFVKSTFLRGTKLRRDFRKSPLF